MANLANYKRRTFARPFQTYEADSSGKCQRWGQRLRNNTHEENTGIINKSKQIAGIINSIQKPRRGNLEEKGHLIPLQMTERRK